MRLGIVGTENSHVDYYLRCFNQEARYPGYRVVALTGGVTDRNLDLARLGAVDRLVEDATDLVDRIDAAIVCSRDGRQHRAEATTLLDAGLPVFVDKPLACSVEDARAILDAARRAGVATCSYSSLRWAPIVTELARQIGHGPPPRRVDVTGPADPASEYAGIWFYGIHVVEIALALLPGAPVEDLTVQRAADRVLVNARAGTTELSLTLVRPGASGLPPWEMTVDGDGGPQTQRLVLEDDYGAPGVAQLVGMLESGRSPLAEAELLAPVEVLAEIETALLAPA